MTPPHGSGTAEREARIGQRGAWCFDCGLDYSDDGFADLVVPHEVWNAHLSPSNDEGGLLCPTCMVRRGARAGLDNVPVSFGSGPFTLAPDAELRMAWKRIDEAESKSAAYRDEVLAMVEGMRKARPAFTLDDVGAYCTACEDDHHDCSCGIAVREWNAALDALASRLDTPTTEEG